MTTTQQLTCHMCGKPARPGLMSIADLDLHLCPGCQAIGAQRILDELRYTGPRCLDCGDRVAQEGRCQACQEDARLTYEGTLTNDPNPEISADYFDFLRDMEPCPPLSTRACCLCNAPLAYPGAPCPVCSIGPCLLCGGAHLFVRCPRVQAERRPTTDDR